MSRAMMICMLSASLAVSVGCSAQASRQTPKVIAEKLYDQLDQSYANHDVNQVLGFTDSTFVGTDERGRRVALAEFRKRLEQWFAVSRRMNPGTTVQDVQLDADRMVVYYKGEMHFEFHDPRNGWVPGIYKENGEDTWEKKGGQWKIVRSTILRADMQVDPTWTARENSREEDRAGREASSQGRNSAAPASSKTLQDLQAPRVIAQKLYDQLDQSVAHKDLNQLLSFFDASYIGTNARGKREAVADVRERMGQVFAMVSYMNQSTTVQDVQLEGDRMVVNYKSEGHLEYRGVPEIVTATVEETWERKGGQWKLVRSTVFRGDTQVDHARTARRVNSLEEDRKDWEMAQRVIECCDSRRPPR